MVGTVHKWEFLAATRFILAFIVLADHTMAFTLYPGPLSWVKDLSAFEAVLGFLLISGYSIGHSILQRKQSYFKRRIKRIYPVYLGAIIVGYLVSPQPITLTFVVVLLMNLIFMNQVFTKTSFGGLPSWTLALEVWLYGLAPLLLKLPYKVMFIIINLSFLSYCIYTFGRTLFHWPYYDGTSGGLNIILLSFIWILGFALATYHHRSQITAYHIAVVIIIHLLITCCIQIGFRIKHHKFEYIFKKDIWEFAGKAVCLYLPYFVIIHNYRIPALSIQIKRVFNLLGNISYPLYLIHLPVLSLCKRIGVNNWLLMVIFCLGTAFIIYWLFDGYAKKRKQGVTPLLAV